MTLETFTNDTWLANNCYLVVDDFSSEAIIIDAPQKMDKLIECVKENDFSIKYILITHGHYDHTEGLPELQKAFPQAEVTQKSVSVGMLDIQSIPTPGHTQDGVCFYISHEQTLFSGDTLFKEEIGRTDLEGGNYEQEIHSIKEKLLILPEHVKVYPGHGKPTTIGWEKENNKYLIGDINET